MEVCDRLHAVADLPPVFIEYSEWELKLLWTLHNLSRLYRELNHSHPVRRQSPV